MAFETIRYDGRDGRIRVTLARPDQRNALTATMVEELAEALERARRDEARALLLTAEGPDFAVGPDPDDPDFPSGEGVDLGAFVESRFNPLLRRLRDLPLPTVTAVHGLAAGAGANLALACDLVLAGSTARFLQDAATLAERGARPGTLRLARPLYDRLDFLGGSDRDLAEPLSGGGVDAADDVVARRRSAGARRRPGAGGGSGGTGRHGRARLPQTGRVGHRGPGAN